MYHISVAEDVSPLHNDAMMPHFSVLLDPKCCALPQATADERWAKYAFQPLGFQLSMNFSTTTIDLGPSQQDLLFILPVEVLSLDDYLSFCGDFSGLCSPAPGSAQEGRRCTVSAHRDRADDSAPALWPGSLGTFRSSECPAGYSTNPQISTAIDSMVPQKSWIYLSRT